MSDKLGVLIVEDDPQLIRILQAVLQQVDADIRIAGTGRLALQELQDSPPSIILLDMRLPDMQGIEILKEAARRSLPATVIVMTAHGSVDLAVEAMREGAYDFLTKPLDFERVRIMVRNAIERHRIIGELDNYKSLYERASFRGLMGSSPAMQRLYRQVRAIGATASPVLIAGEEGTEIDACARAIHDESKRAKERFEVCSAATLTAQNLSSAISNADGGTLYLRHIERLPTEIEEALFEVVQSNSLFGNPLNVRVIAGSETPNPILGKRLAIALSVARVNMPSLRDRGEDVLDMAEQILASLSKEASRSFTGFDDEVQVGLVNYKWPGNRKELEEAIRQVLMHHEGRIVTREMLPKAIAAACAAESQSSGSDHLRGLAVSGSIRPLWEVEREEIEKALALCDGNVLQAARLLQISPATIYRKQQSWRALSS